MCTRVIRILAAVSAVAATPGVAAADNGYYAINVCGGGPNNVLIPATNHGGMAACPRPAVMRRRGLGRAAQRPACRLDGPRQRSRAAVVQRAGRNGGRRRDVDGSHEPR